MREFRYIRASKYIRFNRKTLVVLAARYDITIPYLFANLDEFVHAIIPYLAAPYPYYVPAPAYMCVKWNDLKFKLTRHE